MPSWGLGYVAFLAFLLQNRQICCRINFRRNSKMEEKFTVMCSELIEKGTGEHEDFRSLCNRMGADEIHMNNLFYENFGVSGEEVFNKFLIDSIVIAV